MLQSSELFSIGPQNFIEVLSLVFKIYGAEWKPLTGLAVLFLLTYVGVAVVVEVIAAALFLGEVSYLVTMASQLKSGGLGMASAGGNLRNLAIEYYEKSSRMLSEGYYPKYDPYYGINIGAMVISMVLILLSVALVLSFITSVFGGAFVHAVGEIYAGNTPIVKNSLQRGWMRKWSVFGYHILLGLLDFLILLVTFFLPLYIDFRHLETEMEETGSIKQSEVFFPMIIAGIFSAIILGIIVILLTAAVPAIMIENKSIIASFKRSFELCKENLCLIFLTMFVFFILQQVTAWIVRLIFGSLSAFLVTVATLTLKVLSWTIHPILSFVLYMTMRVRKEGLTQEEFGNEIGSSIPVAHAVEMNVAGGKYMPTQTVDDAEVI